MKKTSGNYRWNILALLFAATVINYFDRSIIGILGPTLRNHVFHWTDQTYANIQIAFKVGYALGLLLMGVLIDKIGTKKGYTLSIVIWCLFGALHAFINRSMGWIGFALARLGLGLGEAGNFPAAIKTVAEWFPVKERAYATGLFNAGSNVGAILAPLIVASFVGNDGSNWQYAFVLSPCFSLLWIIFWQRIYRSPDKHPRLSAAELAYISEDREPQATGRIPLRRLLKTRQAWVFAIAKTTDAVWLFYLFWGGIFLNRSFGLELAGLALPLIVIYLLADAGSIAGGWFSSRLISRGMPTHKARKMTLFISALIVLPVVFAPQVQHAWVAIILIGIAAAGHQAWSSNLFTLASDIFPKSATASIVGFGGMIGYAAGALSDLLLGKSLERSGHAGYTYAFLAAGLLYFVVLVAIHLGLGKMKPLDAQKLSQI